MNRVLPVLTVIAAIIAIWYAAAVWLNAPWAYDQAERAGTTVSFTQVLADTMGQERPVLPPPHQVLAELKKTVLDTAPTSKRSLIYHGLITLQATFFGFAIGLIVGILMAIGIMKSRAIELGLMPWAIISQAIPIVALAPMIVVLSGKLGIDGRLIPKAIISAYLGFFPVLVSMIKGLRSPDPMQLDLLKTWNASGVQEFVKLRLPASLPYLFAALKVALAASLVGAIVGELPTGAVEGLGARMLVGSQFGQPIIMWAALIAATVLAAALILIVGFIERGLMRLTGARP
jgi:NitT/TauT family transport system permease protein